MLLAERTIIRFFDTTQRSVALPPQTAFDPTKKGRCMHTHRIFGTDGVRGKANTEPVTAETALQLGRAAAHVFKSLEVRSRSRGKHKIVIGKDTRVSGYMLENALSAGVLSMGVDVLLIGPVPTPGVAYVTR